MSSTAAGLFVLTASARRSPRRNLSIDTLIVVETAVREAGDRVQHDVGRQWPRRHEGKHRRFALEILNGVYCVVK